MTTLELLIKSKELIKDPNAWTKEVYARNKDGYFTPDTSQDACQWCLVGALWKGSTFLQGDPVLDTTKGKLVNDACVLLTDALGHGGLSAWNDSDETSHDDVINLLDKAIELAKEQS